MCVARFQEIRHHSCQVSTPRRPCEDLNASRRVSPADLRGVAALSEETTLKTRMVVSMEAHARTTDEGVLVLPAAAFFERLWADGVVVA